MVERVLVSSSDESVFAVFIVYIAIDSRMLLEACSLALGPWAPELNGL